MIPSIYQAAGAVIVAAVALQAVLLTISSIRRYAQSSAQQNLALELLMSKVDIAKGIYKEVESSEHSWPGYRKFSVQRKER